MWHLLMTDRPKPRLPPEATQPRDAPDVAELRRLGQRQPELRPAVDLQIALVNLQRRVQARVPLPTCVSNLGPDGVVPPEGRGFLRFEDLPLEWSEFRLVLRETADLLLRYEAMDAVDHRRLLDVTRDGHRLEPLVKRWYEATSSGTAHEPEAFEQAFALALRPFLARCADALQPWLNLSERRGGRCPLCWAEPEFGVFTASGDRHLVCGRCTARWPFHGSACPYCGNDHAARLTAFASPDNCYRLDACDVCRRYLKSIDERRSPRALLLSVDTIATLPMDAAAIQRGYLG